MRTLTIATLALALTAFGCGDDDDDTNRMADGSVKADATSDATGDGSRADGGRSDVGGDGSTADAGGDGAGDVVADTSTDFAVSETAAADTPIVAVDTAPPSGDTAGDPFATCKTPETMTDVAAGVFCMQVQSICGFGTAAGKFADMGACLTRYGSYTPAQKSCTAYHLCVASTSASNAMNHCPHPAGAPNNNPCNLPL